VAEVEHKQLVVHVVIGRRAKAHRAKEPVPSVRVLGVHEHEPVGVQSSESHVGPDVGRHQPRGEEEGQQDHAEGVCGGPVEGVEEARVGEAVVRLVRQAVEGGAHVVLQHVDSELQKVDDQQLDEDVKPVDAPGEGVVAAGHPVQHPVDDEVGAQHDEALRLREVSRDALHQGVGAGAFFLDGGDVAQASRPPEGEVDKNEDLAHCNREESKRESQRRRISLSEVSGCCVIPLGRKHFLITVGARHKERKSDNKRPY
jgi:hypothetical protein